MSDSIKITTNAFRSGLIEQVVEFPYQGVMKLVLQTKEKQVRSALISLGWTPPAEQQGGATDSESNDLNRDAQDVLDAALNTPMSPHGPRWTRRLQIAAALTAAVNRVIPDRLGLMDPTARHEAELIRSDFLAIAAKLKQGAEQ